MADATPRISGGTKDRLAVMAAAEGLSLRAYLARLAEMLPTPAERVERTELADPADRARAAPQDWNGYAPAPPEQHALDTELDRRLAEARGG
ncbi:hypothetical protein OG756_17185 [Streptomyces sp. NBC_01310]|uniref:hypothetical protein n=1 Tax=Streptomyces sp. NBC_01310 TaxID=2903820 RepID=UPI0035B69F5D|nr:hypothetical protein OG756_17185 [Streptomyces sp. NBC_01310]